MTFRRGTSVTVLAIAAALACMTALAATAETTNRLRPALDTVAAWTAVVVPATGSTAGPRDPLWTASLSRARGSPRIETRIETGALPAHRSPAPRLPSLTGPTHALDGLASFYWQPQMTASGEVFDKRQMTAAHKTLPMHTRVRVTSVATGRSVIVRINDRGPYKPGRVIDLSEAAAQDLGITTLGIAPVKIEVVRN